MPTIIQVIAAAGQNIYVFIYNVLGQIWNTNTSAFETETDGNVAYYAITATQQGTTASYLATIPTGITTAGNYTWAGFIRIGASPATSDTPVNQGPFVIPTNIGSYSFPSTLNALITTLRGLVDDAPDSKIVYGETLGSGDTPMFPVNGSNTTFRLKKPLLSDYAGSPSYTWVTIVGSGATVRSQTGFTIADQINGVISFNSAPNPGGSAPNGVYVDYNWQYYSDAKYAQWLYQAAQMTLAGTTDPTTIVNGLSDAMLQYAVYLVYSALATRYAPQIASSGGDAHTDAQTPAQVFRNLAKDALASAKSLQTLYYQRQGQRNAPAWADINHHWDPISPIR